MIGDLRVKRLALVFQRFDGALIIADDGFRGAHFTVGRFNFIVDCRNFYLILQNEQSLCSRVLIAVVIRSKFGKRLTIFDYSFFCRSRWSLN